MGAGNFFLFWQKDELMQEAQSFEMSRAHQPDSAQFILALPYFFNVEYANLWERSANSANLCLFEHSFKLWVNNKLIILEIYANLPKLVCCRLLIYLNKCLLLSNVYLYLLSSFLQIWELAVQKNFQTNKFQSTSDFMFHT